MCKLYTCYDNAMRLYSDLDIQIGAQNAESYSVMIRGLGGEAQGILYLADEERLEPLMSRLLQLDVDEDLLMQLGSALFDALFQGPVRDVYTRSQGALTNQQSLRIRLHFVSNVPHLSSLPWEFMYDPHQGPLALLDTPIVRFLPQQDKLPVIAAPLPLRVLLTAAQTPPAINIERELSAAQDALAPMADRVSVTIESHLTMTRFQQLLRSGFHVWHFVGHGNFDAQGSSGHLLFEDALGDPERVSAMQLGIMLNRSGLRLVILDACSSGQIATDPFRSIAPALVRAQIPAVIAMQFQVPEETTVAFSTEFYRALAEGQPIDACVTEGRRAVMNVSGLGRADWGIPVVYTRAQDGRLFEAPATTPMADIEPVEHPATEPIGEGLDALRLMMETTADIHEAVVAFRTDFQVASEQIDALGMYKDLHDQLHALQIHCYNLVALEIRRTSSEDVAWDTLSNYELTLQGVSEQVRRIAATSSLGARETAWVADLALSQSEMAAAIEDLDLQRLKKSARLLNRVLTIQPVQINARLSAAARMLRLETLVQALRRIRDRLPANERTTPKGQQFEQAVGALGSLSIALAIQVNDHDLHQAVDLELRRIETTLDHDLYELEQSWPELKSLAQPLYINSADAWSSMVQSESSKLDQACAVQDPVKMRHFFRRYRRQMGDRFYRVDVDLKRLCDDLRVIGEPLNAVLQIMT